MRHKHAPAEQAQRCHHRLGHVQQRSLKRGSAPRVSISTLETAACENSCAHEIAQANLWAVAAVVKHVPSRVPLKKEPAPENLMFECLQSCLKHYRDSQSDPRLDKIMGIFAPSLTHKQSEVLSVDLRELISKARELWRKCPSKSQSPRLLNCQCRLTTIQPHESA